MNALKNMKKTTRSNLITYGIVVVFYATVSSWFFTSLCRR